MRKQIRELLIQGVSAVNGEVWEPSAAGPDLPKPHLVVREGPRTPGDPYANHSVTYEVWPYVERTTFQQVDLIAQQVINTLDGVSFNVEGAPHYIEYSGTISEDIVDEEWEALTRGLQFRVYSLAWLVHVGESPDPVDAMRAWTAKHLPEFQTDPATWSPSATTPAVYWRYDATVSTEPTNWGTWITARLLGHVFVPDMSLRRQWTERIVRQLALHTKAQMDDGSRMRFTNISADSDRNPFTAGQIELTVVFGVLRKEEPVQPLLNVYTRFYSYLEWDLDSMLTFDTDIMDVIYQRAGELAAGEVTL